MRKKTFILILLFNVIIFSISAIVALASDPVAAKIRGRISELRDSGKLKIAGASIAAADILPGFYENRNYEPAWSRPYTIAKLIATIRNSHTDGLDPGDYHYETLKSFRKRIENAQPATPESLADFDILLSDSFIRLAYHQYFGKVDPETLNPYLQLVRLLDGKEPMRLLLEAIESDRLDRIIDNLKPVHPFYLRLKKALARYRAIQYVGGWQEIPTGGRITAGSRDDRVPLIRRRLYLTGDLKNSDFSSDLFDEELHAALSRFQARNYLEPDGIADRSTVRVLNEPVQQRINQILANIERARWVLHSFPLEYVLVDIAGYAVHYIKNGAPIWSGRAQVGQPYRQTPVFKSKITSLVLNPTWTVPPGIFRHDILPKVQKNPKFLQELDLKVYTFAGQPVDPTTIDWSKYPARKFPYILRQGPGPTNPIGDIKFVLPNPFYIYLHDTPEQEEFDTPWRALSAGCIRLERPLELAQLILKDRKRWSIHRIAEKIKSGQTINLSLPNPKPILLIYMTVWVDQEEVVYFREDVYSRDAKILKGLKGEFKFRRRPLTLNPLL